jgi:hypothetical protein
VRSKTENDQELVAARKQLDECLKAPATDLPEEAQKKLDDNIAAIESIRQQRQVAVAPHHKQRLHHRSMADGLTCVCLYGSRGRA